MTKTGLKGVLLCSGATFLAWHSSAQAAGTEAGTSIANTATVSYLVGGSPQTASSNTASFFVDRKVNLTVTGGVITQAPLGSTDQVTAFQVTNLTNGTQDFHLTIDQQSLSVPILGVDNFDVTSMRVFVDSNHNGIYDPGVDTATFIDELAPDTAITVFIVSNIPNVPGENVAIVRSPHRLRPAGSWEPRAQSCRQPPSSPRTPPAPWILCSPTWREPGILGATVSAARSMPIRFPQRPSR
ncbi:MAG: hypothetical protein JWO15_3157 [Sphingomonadales bacterium]|nr:hypothetical protein [Sphingomonadales bacterium]